MHTLVRLVGSARLSNSYFWKALQLRRYFQADVLQKHGVAFAICSAAPEGRAQPQSRTAANTKKRRLDELCGELFPQHTLKEIRSWIVQGKVTVKGAVQTKVGVSVSPKDPVCLNVQLARYVNRAGFKLEAALQHFGLDVKGKTALDAGLSTGGFTDCLLQHGSASVVGVDVGFGQVAQKLRADARVHLLERTNLRYCAPEHLPGKEQVDIVTLDLSFISILSVMPAVVLLLRQPGNLVTLIKPQFEAERHQVRPGGIVENEQVRQEVVARVVSGISSYGLTCKGIMESPVRGAASGNVEYLAVFEHGPSDTAPKTILE